MKTNTFLAKWNALCASKGSSYLKMGNDLQVTFEHDSDIYALSVSVDGDEVNFVSFTHYDVDSNGVKHQENTWLCSVKEAQKIDSVFELSRLSTLLL